MYSSGWKLRLPCQPLLQFQEGSALKRIQPTLHYSNFTVCNSHRQGLDTEPAHTRPCQHPPYTVKPFARQGLRLPGILWNIAIITPA